MIKTYFNYKDELTDGEEPPPWFLAVREIKDENDKPLLVLEIDFEEHRSCVVVYNERATLHLSTAHGKTIQTLETLALKGRRSQLMDFVP